MNACFNIVYAGVKVDGAAVNFADSIGLRPDPASRADVRNMFRSRSRGLKSYASDLNPIRRSAIGTHWHDSKLVFNRRRQVGVTLLAAGANLKSFPRRNSFALLPFTSFADASLLSQIVQATSATTLMRQNAAADRSSLRQRLTRNPIPISIEVPKVVGGAAAVGFPGGLGFGVRAEVAAVVVAGGVAASAGGAATVVVGSTAE